MADKLELCMTSLEDISMHLPDMLESDEDLTLFHSITAILCLLSKVVIVSLEVAFFHEQATDQFTRLVDMLGPIRSIETLVDISILLRYHWLRLSTQALIDLLTLWPRLQYVHINFDCSYDTSSRGQMPSLESLALSLEDAPSSAPS